MYKNKKNLKNEFDFLKSSQKSHVSNLNQSHDNNQFLSLDHEEDYGLKLPNIANDKKTLTVNKSSPKEEPNIRRANINIEYNKNNRTEHGRIISRTLAAGNQRKQSQKQNYYNRQDSEDGLGGYKVQNRNKQEIINNKMSHHLSLNQSGIKMATKEVTGSKSTNIPKFIGGRISNKSQLKTNSKSGFSQKKSRLSMRKQDDGGHSKKYSAQIEKILLDLDYQNSTAEQIEKQNDKIRAMVRRFNNELNQIIDRVTLLHKKSQQQVPLQKQIQILSQNVKNNQKIIERGKIDISKLMQKVGSIKDSDYQSQVNTSILQLKAIKKQLEKQIIQSKATNTKVLRKPQVGVVKSNEITKNDLLHLNKQVEKHQSNDKKLQFKLKEIELKHDVLEDRYDKILEEAQEKGISIKSVTGALAKQNQLQEKQKQLKKGIQNIQTLYKSKADIMNNQNQRIKRNILNCEAQVKDVYSQIVDLASRSSLLIEKQRQNPKLFKNVLSSLESFTKSVANPPNLQFERMAVESRISNSHSNYQDSVINKPQSQIHPVSQKTQSPKIIKQTNNRYKPNLINIMKANSSSERQVRQQETKDKLNNLQINVNIKSDTDGSKQSGSPSSKPSFNLRKRIQSQTQKIQQQSPTPKPKELLTIKPFTRIRKQSQTNNSLLTQIRPQQKLDNTQTNLSSLKPKQTQQQQYPSFKRLQANKQIKSQFQSYLLNEKQIKNHPNQQSEQTDFL